MQSKGRARSAAVTAAALVLAAGGTAVAKFGQNGRVITDLGGTNSASAVAIAPDGKIVAAGSMTNTTFDFATVRYRKGGGLDTNFAAAGKRIDDLGGFDSINDVLVQPNRRIVVAGTGGGTNRATVARYKPGGGLDTNFGASGFTQVILPGTHGFNAVTRQRDGKIVAVGEVGDAMLVVRLRKNGNFDSSFATNGVRILTFDSVNSASAVAIDRKNKIVVAGRTSAGGMAAPSRMAFARLRPNGNLDKSFSKDGKRVIPIPGFSVRANDVLTRGKKIYAVGERVGTPTHPVLVRLGKKGGLDKKFAGKGMKVHRFGAKAEINALAFQGKKLVGAGQRDDPVADFFAARFKPNGAKDKSFGKKGWRTVNINGGDVADDIAVQKNKRLVLAGSSGGTAGFVLVRLKPGGALDK